MVSFIHTLSHTVFALNEGARKNLCALLPTEVVSNMEPPSTQRASWEEDMLCQLTYLEADADETVQADSEVETYNGKAFISLCVVVLAKADTPALGGAFLYTLPLHMQASVIHGLLTRSTQTCLFGLEGPQLEFVEYVRQLLETNERWGEQWAGNIMRSGSVQSIQLLLEELDGRDSQLTHILQQHLFQFSDLLSLSARDLQLVLSSESDLHIALALQGISEDQTDQVLTQVSPRRKRLILDEADRYVDAASDEVIEAYQAIISTARLLQLHHRITTFIPGLYRMGGSVTDETIEIVTKEVIDPNGPVERSKKRPASSSSPIISSIPLKRFGLGVLFVLPLLWFLIKNASDNSDSAKDGGGGQQQWVIGGSTKPNAQNQSADVDKSINRNSYRQTGMEMPGISVSGDYSIESAHALGSPDSTRRVLFLRLGEVQANIMKDNFSIQTPLIRVESPIGARYHVRVILDASSEVRVEDGWVEVESVKKPGNSVRMVPGQVHKFTHSAWE